MSGHSKWSKVKHQKESSDAARGKIFTKLANAITIAVRAGSGSTDPEVNFKLRLATEKAKAVNMPKENINRAIERASGMAEGETLSEVVYEAFGPGGVAIIIEAATDNKQRTVAELKNILERGGGVLAGSGAVLHFFKLVGLINISKSGKSFDEVMEAAINFGAIDLEKRDDSFEVYTNPAELHRVKQAMEKMDFPISSFELYYKPVTTVPINDSKVASQLLKLLESIEERDDVQKVFSNFDIPDEISHTI